MPVLNHNYSEGCAPMFWPLQILKASSPWNSVEALTRRTDTFLHCNVPSSEKIWQGIYFSNLWKVWYFIYINQLALQTFHSTQDFRGSHSQSVSDSVATYASLVTASFWHFHSQSASHRCVYVASASWYLKLVTVLDYTSTHTSCPKSRLK